MEKENKYQAKLIKKIESRFPECIVTKQDANYIQGIPDIEIHYNGRYAWLEAKKSKDEPHRPNQDDYIRYANEHGAFGAFIYPENEEEVLDAMERSFSI